MCIIPYRYTYFPNPVAIVMHQPSVNAIVTDGVHVCLSAVAGRGVAPGQPVARPAVSNVQAAVSAAQHQVAHSANTKTLMCHVRAYRLIAASCSVFGACSDRTWLVRATDSEEMLADARLCGRSVPVRR